MKVKISNIAVSDLENTGSFLDKQDPAVKFVVLNKSRADRASLMNVFRFFGFKAVAPGNKYISQNEDVITMVYEIEQ